MKESMTVKNGPAHNYGRPPLRIAHASLPKWDGERSAYRVLCPVCRGILPVQRDGETMRILREDVCVRCGQRVHYTDKSICGERLAEDDTPQAPYLRPTATQGVFETVWPDRSGHGNDAVGPAQAPVIGLPVRVTQHIPNFVDEHCARPDPVEVRTVHELLLVPFVAQWRTKDYGQEFGAFVRFSTSQDSARSCYLMAEFRRKFWVVAYLDGDGAAIEALGLPRWEAP